MGFIANDLYLSSGTGGIINSWTPAVTKFDPSTFYNWEQDNEPLYDLDERTEYLWERIGYPIQDGFSGISGKMFVVSADAPYSVTSDSSGVFFRDLSTVINVLPNPITYPIIIEVASFGELGELNLNNIKIDDSCPGAGLEIINRNFGRTYLINGTTSGAKFSSNTELSSLYASSVNTDLTQAKSLRFGTFVASATSDARWNTNRGWITRLPFGTSQERGIGAGYISFNASPLVSAGGTGMYVNPYTVTQDATLSSDISGIVSYDGTVVYNSGGGFNSTRYAHYFQYGNYLTKLTVDNCTGPIYLRNFCIDGGGSTSGGTLMHTTDFGVDINNSKIILENTLSMRCKSAGFRVNNSYLTVRRGLFGVRNYPLTTYNTRSTSSFGIGLEANNSTIKIESQTSPILVSGLDVPIHFAYNDIGLQLNNSKLFGGDAASGSLNAAWGTGILHSFNNKQCGIKAIDSEYLYDGVTRVLQNATNIKLINSYAEFPVLFNSYASETGLDAVNSVIVQNPKLLKFEESLYLLDKNVQMEQFYYSGNGQHLILDNSKLTYIKSNQMPDKFGLSLFHSNLGYEGNSSYNRVIKPSIEIKNNSTAEFIHAKIQTLKDQDSTFAGASVQYLDNDAIFGACVRVTNNSKVKFLGSKTAPTVLLGSNVYNTKIAAAYASDHSEIEFNGNTLIGQIGVDVLAEKNSTIKFNPHRNENGSLDVSGWNLDDTENHTRVELHATRACLVADSNSIISMEHLGDFHAGWPESQTSSVDYNQTNGLGTSAYTYTGYMQFYPNAQDSSATTDVSTRYNLGFATYNTRNFTTDHFLVDLSNNANVANDILNYSTGGMCVRALDGSRVNVFNVNFPTGWANTSGFYFSTSATECERLRIWNLCDDSELHAAYCSVSSTYPSLAGYIGPSAVYVSGAAKTIAYGAPSSTPDTSTLSVLDWYGASSTRAGTNYGPFRLFFSPKGRTKFLTTSASNGADYGVVYQVVSQGYNPSGSCSAVSNLVSAIYADISTPQFYYVSALVDSSFANRIRLDESAADTFANAKHNALAKSGRPTLVTIYRSRGPNSTGSQANGIMTYTIGLKSAEIFDLRRDN